MQTPPSGSFRRSPGGGYGERVVVANVDQVVVVFAAARPEPHPRMLDRFLVVAEANGVAGSHVFPMTSNGLRVRRPANGPA